MRGRMKNREEEGEERLEERMEEGTGERRRRGRDGLVTQANMDGCGW